MWRRRSGSWRNPRSPTSFGYFPTSSTPQRRVALGGPKHLYEDEIADALIVRSWAWRFRLMPDGHSDAMPDAAMVAAGRR
jgi:hypothetical protein